MSNGSASIKRLFHDSAHKGGAGKNCIDDAEDFAHTGPPQRLECLCDKEGKTEIPESDSKIHDDQVVFIDKFQESDDPKSLTNHNLLKKENQDSKPAAQEGNVPDLKPWDMQSLSNKSAEDMHAKATVGFFA